MVEPAAATGTQTRGVSDRAPGEARLHITYYTDPLCAWSWALEPQWRLLQFVLGDQLDFCYCMGGMISDWNRYNDPLNDVSRPVQMGPLWYQVRAISGMPINDRIWFANAPTSSYPACTAVKGAELQGEAFGRHYLRLLREAVMIEGQNIAQPEVQCRVATALACRVAGFDAARFQRDLGAPPARDRFRDDLKDVRWREIGRFPTMILRAADRAIMIVGYRPYGALLEAVQHVVPEISPQELPDPVSYIQHWGHLTTREVAECMQQPVAETEAALAELAEAGKLKRRPLSRMHQSIWSVP
ncbi:MAG: DsbA family protein [Caldilineaceae bacterium]|nr:DsbA family protein [Caldilineaceae bacterium]